MKEHIGRSNILFATLDTLRFDVAQELFLQGKLPNFARYLPATGWQRRHTPATFTYAAHHAFFAGFLPTPTQLGPHARLFASAFGGSETTTATTYVFEQPSLPQALANAGYHTVCIGGTGFFNPSNALGRVLPALFDEAHWSREMSVTEPESPARQVDCAIEVMERHAHRKLFCFINFAAIHQPNWFYATDKDQRCLELQNENRLDTLHSHGQALVAIDREWGRLIECFQRHGSLFGIICSDHGTAYGEEGYRGHRVAHPVVWDVPYAEFEATP